jgi:regulator of sirC expression with transglutaminase-like and TPR domain
MTAEGHAGGAANFRDLFAWQIGRPEEDLDLDRAALFMAGEEYPDLDVEACLDELDRHAEVVRALAGPSATPVELAATLGRYLFIELGFQGNSGDYYNPDNSYLNRVLETRTGIPITLSLLFMEVGRRAGLRARGVGLPGHFIVGLEGQERYLDPFNGGTVLTADGCRELVEGLFGDRLQWSDDYLVPCTKYEFLFRMLNNLKVVYERNEDFAKAVGATQRMIMLSPDRVSLHKDIAWCHYQLQQYRLAIRSLESYLQQEQAPSDAVQIRGQINAIRDTLNRLN